MKDILEPLGIILFFIVLALLIAPEETAYTIGHAIFTFKNALTGG